MYLIHRLQRVAFRRFMDGRKGPWGMVAAVAFGVRTLLRWSKRSDDVVYRAKLEPGETVTIAHREDSVATTRKAERAAAKAQRRPSRRRAIEA